MQHHGWADEGFANVADAFARNFAEGGELGAALAVFVDGRKVVDLWGGTADRRTGRPWERDTALPVFSCSKVVVSVCALLLAQHGRLDLDAPVAVYWPEFGQRGKETVTTRMVLANTAGVPHVEAALSMSELTAWDPVVRALEKQKPLWEPGTAYEYHAHAFGFIVGEVIRRITGSTPGGLFREAVADELGLHTWLGVPEEEFPRLARIAEGEERAAMPDADSLLVRSVTMNGVLVFPGVDDPHGWNAYALLGAEFPGAGAVSTARGLATLYAAAATGVDGSDRLLTAETVTDAVAPQSGGPSWSGLPDLGARWGTGFVLDCPSRRLLGPRSFANEGAGGQIAFGDDAFGIGFAYTANLMGGPGDERADRLIDAVRESVGA
ncbi:serine hydrolase domain-containing protein [Streptomyces sp. NPDC048639]|uniref:serine hydrolase domain-containing protein n=1 Tax=Streptomyces sp. NPDC048639 TaxID=3365581 RepID=UPI003719088E